MARALADRYWGLLGAADLLHPGYAPFTGELRLQLARVEAWSRRAGSHAEVLAHLDRSIDDLRPGLGKPPRPRQEPWFAPAARKRVSAVVGKLAQAAGPELAGEVFDKLARGR